MVKAIVAMIEHHVQVETPVDEFRKRKSQDFRSRRRIRCSTGSGKDHACQNRRRSEP
jgi:hypothetical protein